MCLAGRMANCTAGHDIAWGSCDATYNRYPGTQGLPNQNLVRMVLGVLGPRITRTGVAPTSTYIVALALDTQVLMQLRAAVIVATDLDANQWVVKMSWKRPEIPGFIARKTSAGIRRMAVQKDIRGQLFCNSAHPPLDSSCNKGY